MWLVFALSACSRPAPPAPEAAPPAAAPAGAPEEAAPAARTPRNRPPVIDQITLSPKEPKRGDAIQAQVDASDPEGTSLDLDYAWTVNGNPVLDVAADTLPAGRVVKGDRVQVTVKAYDGADEVSVQSAVSEVGNTPPVIQTTRMSKVDGFAFSAADPDGDSLSWRLEGAPGGMSISSDGVLSYKGTEDDPGGDYKVAVIVEDGQAWGRYEFPVSVKAGSKGKKAEDAASR